ncbi:MAG: hypothetical protein ACKV1O_13480 [Saprospiraceae bacterium]
MKIWTTLFVFTIVLTSFKPLNPHGQPCYLPEFVEISSVKYKNETYTVVTMRRDGDRIKAKYFAARDYNGSSVYNRFLEWKKTNPNVILLSSGTYMDNNENPQGLTIDNGVVVNENLIYDKMDAIAIVYATGGIAVSNLKDGDLRVSGINRALNLRKSGIDLDDFIDWTKNQEATVFQTHLLVYKNQVKVNPNNSSKTSRERRFLAVGKEESGKIIHTIIHCPTYSTLYDGTNKALDFLNNVKDLEIIFMINLDTGAQDVFELHNSDCTTNGTMKGQQEPAKAVNLLTYYFK